jgi:hypothetical protein
LQVWEQWFAWCAIMRLSPWLTFADIRMSAAQLGAFAKCLWKYGMNQRQRGNIYSVISTTLCGVR